MSDGVLRYEASGDEITVNSTYARTQAQAEVARLADGNFIVTWIDADFNTSAGRFIRGQIYAPDGTPIGGELTLVSANNLIRPVVCGLAGGGFALVWQGWQVDAQIFDANGVATTSVFHVAQWTSTISSSGYADVTALANGGFAVSWEDTRTVGGDVSGSGIHVRAFDQYGVETQAETQVNTVTARNQADSSITSLAGGGYIVTWTDRSGDWLVKAQIFDASGAKVGSEFTVNNTPATSVESSVVALANGNFAVAWNDSGAHHIQIFSAAGVPVGAQIDVATAYSGTQVGPELAALSDGGLALAFLGNYGAYSDGSGSAVYVQVIGADGTLTGDPMLVNSQTNGDQVLPAILGLDDGAFVVTWSDLNGSGADDDQVKGQVFTPHWSVAISSGDGAAEASVSASENDTAVTTITAGNHGGAAIGFNIAGGADAALFAIDNATGALTFVAAPDFEAPGDADGDNVYEVIVAASDGHSSDTQTIAVTVGNVNEGLAFTSPSAFAIDENDAFVAALVAADVDGDTPAYSIAGGADAALFAIDAATGELRFLAAPDFEAPGDADGDNIYDVVVAASDGSLTTTQALAVTVNDVTSGLGFATPTLALTLAENARVAGTVTPINENGTQLYYGIVGGSDAALFAIDSQGRLGLITPPDFEAPGDANGDNVYEVVVAAGDGGTPVFQTVYVTVGNVDEGVHITSGAGGGATTALTLAENQTAVATVTAFDEDGDVVHYQIAGGADAALFEVDALTGALRFIDAPNFEAPADADHDGHYQVAVAAISGSYGAGYFSDVQAFDIAVTNVNEGIAITSNGGGSTAAISVVENNRGVTTVTSLDPDGTPASYAIVGGVDAALFTINATTGLLQFVTAPDYEAPSDATRDNIYSVIVRVSDGELSDTQTLSVKVTDAIGRTINGTSAADTITTSTANSALRTTSEADIVNGNAGNDIIQTGAGDDTLIGGTGADQLIGGAGADQFVYNTVSDSTASVSSRDQITDFSHAQGDKIVLSTIDANTVATGNQAFTFIGSSAFTHVAGQLHYEVSGGYTYVSGDVDGDGVADFQVQLAGSIALTGADFVL